VIQILTYIIIGIILATIGLSLLTGVAELIEVFLEWLKCWFAVKIAEYNVRIGDLA